MGPLGTGPKIFRVAREPLLKINTTPKLVEKHAYKKNTVVEYGPRKPKIAIASSVVVSSAAIAVQAS